MLAVAVAMTLGGSAAHAVPVEDWKKQIAAARGPFGGFDSRS